MVAYSFKRRFVEPIRAGSKAQTIRAERKRHARPGETLQLYTGMRTRSCMLIGTATCSLVSPIRFDFISEAVRIGDGPAIIDRASRNKFARLDGFADWDDLCAFWAAEHGLSLWSGMLIRWTGIVVPA